MDRHSAFPGSWLKSQDLDGDLTVTIKSCDLETLGQGQDAQTKPVMAFNETEKKLVINQTNWDAIEALHGPDSEGWIGKKITLYVDPHVRFGSKVVPALRVRPMVTRQTPAGLMSYQDAVHFCAQNGIVEDVLKEHLRAYGLTKWNGAVCTPVVRKFIADLIPPADMAGDAAEDDISF